MAKGKNNCCFNIKDYQFRNEFNLSEQLTKVCNAGKLDLAQIFEESLINHLITHKNKNCILKVNNLLFYIRSIQQDTLSSSMEARQVITFSQISCDHSDLI